MEISLPVALTVAGLDPSGGAGVLADVRTFAAFGFQASAAVTSVTFQNERRFAGAVHQTGETVRAQIEALLETKSIACAKTGMLPTREVVAEVARLFQKRDLPAPVVDPVLVSSSGGRLMDEDAVEVLVRALLPLCRVVTPNIPEAEALTGLRISSEADMRKAAEQVRKLGARAVLVKGGHLGQEGDAGLSPDVLDDDGTVTVFRNGRVAGVELHGSGCILSAAIAAGLGKGLTLVESVQQAKSFVSSEFRKLSVSTVTQ